jgi:MarR family transcriptional regulator for hemolysin
MPTLEERFSAALHNSARGWRLAVDRRLKGLGLSQAAWMTVAVAAKARAPLAQVELADRVGVEGATMVAMLDRLAKAGLVRRTACTEDRRVKRVSLTSAGEALYAKVRVEAAAVRRELLAGVDPRLLETATTLLEHIQATIDGEP